MLVSFLILPPTSYQQRKALEVKSKEFILSFLLRNPGREARKQKWEPPWSRAFSDSCRHMVPTLTLYTANEDSNQSPPMVPSESLLYDREFLKDISFCLVTDNVFVPRPHSSSLSSYTV